MWLVGVLVSWACDRGDGSVTCSNHSLIIRPPTHRTYTPHLQALADAAYFVDVYNATLGGESPWVVFGASYSSSMALWFNAQFPNLVVGTVGCEHDRWVDGKGEEGGYGSGQQVKGGRGVCVSSQRGTW